MNIVTNTNTTMQTAVWIIVQVRARGSSIVDRVSRPKRACTKRRRFGVIEHNTRADLHVLQSFDIGLRKGTGNRGWTIGKEKVILATLIGLNSERKKDAHNLVRCAHLQVVKKHTTGVPRCFRTRVPA